MKKKITKLLALVLSLCVCTTASAGACTKPNAKDDPNTIYVYNYNGGFGTEWLYKAKAAYEALNPNITIAVNPQKPAGALVASNIKAGGDELWFSDGSSLYNFFAEGVIEPITKALTTPNPYDDGKIIADKLTDGQKSFYQIVNGEYYALPHYTGYMGFFYNVDTFKTQGLFLKKDRPNESFTAANASKFFTRVEAEFSDGPDGEPGTYDDGLPATYDEFFLLLRYMSSVKGFDTGKKAPITHTGRGNAQYVGETVYSLATDYEGYEQMMMNFTFNGTAKSLGRVVNGQFVRDENPTSIENSNGYELARQEGKYYALQFIDKIYSNASYYNETEAAMSSYYSADAAEKLIEGNAGILIEGVWWEEENRSYFQQKGKTKQDYNFAVMPFPKATPEKVGEKTTLYDHLQSMCYMKAGLTEEKKEKIYDFIQFLYSDAQLINFTATTGTLKGVKYVVPESAKENLTHYEKTLLDYCSKADIIYPGNNNPLYYNNYTTFKSYYYLSSNVAGYSKTTYDNPIMYFINDRISATSSKDDFVPSVNDYFNGMYNYYSSIWNTNFSRYF